MRSASKHVQIVLGHLLVLAGLIGVAGCADYTQCDPQPLDAIARLPNALSETGLYAAPERLAADVHVYAPRFELWSDGAEKRRFVSLPAGAQIDVSDADDWVFPTGTKLWKEFTRDGVRVETRLLYKWGAAREAWVARAYVWTEDGADALAADGGRSNVLGTEHDVPSSAQCFACHGGRQSRALGFSYLQLAYSAASDALTVERLDAEGRLSRTLEARVELPGSEREQRGLGYVHANCGHCHNQARPEQEGARCYDPENRLDFWLRARELAAVADTSIRRSVRPGDWVAGAPQISRIWRLMSRRDSELPMPPLATERVDEAGLRAVGGLIEGP